jgi:hypothetical protein
MKSTFVVAAFASTLKLAISAPVAGASDFAKAPEMLPRDPRDHPGTTDSREKPVIWLRDTTDGREKPVTWIRDTTDGREKPATWIRDTTDGREKPVTWIRDTSGHQDGVVL